MAIQEIEVRMMDELVDFLKNNDIEIAALTFRSQKRLKLRISRAEWNQGYMEFCTLDLNLPKDEIVESVHLSGQSYEIVLYPVSEKADRKNNRYLKTKNRRRKLRPFIKTA